MDSNRADQCGHREKYKGHEIAVDALREGNRWTWHYVITPKNGGKVIAGDSAPHAKLSDPEAAIQRAINAARARADELG